MKISVIGSGAWGTALGLAMNRAGHEVLFWEFNKDAVDSINNERKNPFMPGISIPDSVSATNNLVDVKGSDLLILVVPAQILRQVCQQMAELGVVDMPVMIACKGIEIGSLKLMSEVVKEELSECKIAVLAGPNFADEIAKGMPGATTIACEDASYGKMLVKELGTSVFRTYLATDIIGAQISASVKNVLAIACGISSGRGYGENARAALITRGMVEIERICLAKGGKVETLMGMCGIGDVLLTCSSQKSRNMSFGFQIGEGKNIDEILSQGKTVEGVPTSKSVYDLAKILNIELPICNAVYEIIHNRRDVDQVIEKLLSTPYEIEADV